MATLITEWQDASVQLNNLKGAIERDLVPLLSTPQGASFTIAREWSCYVDHLGALYSGSQQASPRFRDYLTFVLGEVDEAYRDLAGVLLHMFRHGTVHEFDPKVLVNQSNQTLGWAMFTTPRREDFIEIEDGRQFFAAHLKITPHPDVGNQFALWASTHSLVTDLLASIEVFANGLGDPTQRVQRWNRVAKKQVSPTPASLVIPASG